MNWLKPLLIGFAALVVVGLLVGGGIVAFSFIGGLAQNKIDLTYLPPDADLVVLSPEQLRNRRRRNIAIALAIGLMVAFVYTITIVKLGLNVLRPEP